MLARARRPAWRDRKYSTVFAVCTCYREFDLFIVILVYRGQSYIAPLLHNLRFIGRNYIVRFAVYTLWASLLFLTPFLLSFCSFLASVWFLSPPALPPSPSFPLQFDRYFFCLWSSFFPFRLIVPCFFNLPTIFGGITLFVACVCYFLVSDNSPCIAKSFSISSVSFSSLLRPLLMGSVGRLPHWHGALELSRSKMNSRWKPFLMPRLYLHHVLLHKLCKALALHRLNRHPEYNEWT